MRTKQSYRSFLLRIINISMDGVFKIFFQYIQVLLPVRGPKDLAAYF